MHRSFLKSLFFAAFATCSLLLISCEEESLENVVVTEDVLFVSGDFVRLTGRVIQTKAGVDDHGFQIDDNPDFNSPQIITKNC